MNPYLMTITFLMMMSIFTSSKVVRFAETSLSKQMYEQRLTDTFTREEFIASAHIAEFRENADSLEREPIVKKQEERKVERVKRSPSLKFSFSCPPNNSRLNFHLLLHDPKHTSLYEVAAHLMRQLYGSEDFFQKIPNAETLILDRLLEKGEETKEFTYPDELATLIFDDSELQETFYLVLKGSKSFPSLLNYITFDSTSRNLSKINLMFAAPELLLAVLQDEHLTERVLTMREHFWEEILEQEEHRLERTQEDCKTRMIFKRELTSNLNEIDERLAPLFDLSLGHIGNVLLYEDPETGLVLREKAPPKKNL